LGQRAKLEINGNLQALALGWSHEEWRSGRRLVQFWKKQEGATIQVICKPILPEMYVPNRIVISCIFWEVTNECYVTSVDIIYLLEALVSTRFNVEEKNRIRRNLEGLKPKTLSKVGKSNDPRIRRFQEDFFKQVMTFPSPRPRHIEKDIKIFPWKTLGPALNKIIGKYSTTPTSSSSSPDEGFHVQPAPPPAQVQQMQQQQQQNAPSMLQLPQSILQPQQQQRLQQKSPPLHLGIDTIASNASYLSSLQMPQQQPLQQQQQQPPSSFYNSPTMNGFLPPPQPSPRKSLFNMSEFIVSPSFNLTPLQQTQQQSAQSYLAPSWQQYSSPPQSANGNAAYGTLGSNLGLDLGTPRRD
jgi:hypothetical protein